MILINLIVRALTQVVHFPARIPNPDSHIPVCTCYATYSSICPAGNFPSLGNSGNVASVSIDFRVNSKLLSSLPEVFCKKMFLEISQNSPFLTKHLRWLLLKVKTSRNLWLLSEWLRYFSFLWPTKGSPKSCDNLLYQHVLESVKLVHVNKTSQWVYRL